MLFAMMLISYRCHTVVVVAVAAADSKDIDEASRKELFE
jgi:hypothetical protein